MNHSRRKFIGDISKLGLLTTAYPVLSSFSGFVQPDYTKEKITSIELFRYDVDIPRYFSWGTWYNRQHLFMKISAGNYYGWSEIPAATNSPDFDPADWGAYLKDFIGLTIAQAYELLQTQQVPGTKVTTKRLEFIEMGLLDVSGRIQNKPAVELLGMQQRKAIPGIFCILDSDLEKVKQAAHTSIELKQSHHLKFKMYGNQQLDLTLLKTIREIIGEKAIIISDPNNGYKNWNTLPELAAILNEFKDNGLYAIEDPSNLTIDQWIQLQELVGELSLIPDVPMRPSWEGLNKITPGMGRIFNLHPSTMGSFRHIALMVKKIHEIGCKVMIGDDSLVGPGCAAWQQIAIGAGATWVEALEKKEDSKNYLQCLLHTPTQLDDKGYVTYNPKPGFGIEIDIRELKIISKAHITLK